MRGERGVEEKGKTFCLSSSMAQLAFINAALEQMSRSPEQKEWIVAAALASKNLKNARKCSD